jgi:hypothetical protein
MGKPKPPERALLFAGLLYAEKDLLSQCLEELAVRLGPVFFKSPEMRWEHSDYYRDEIGWPLFRRFIAFERILSPDEIREIKLITNVIEDTFSEHDKRRINIDPGYITPSKLVLATTKNYAHRIYLGKGIYAEVTLYYRKGSFRAHEFTYLDYQSEEYIRIFNYLRAHLMKQAGSESADFRKEKIPAR